MFAVNNGRGADSQRGEGHRHVFDRQEKLFAVGADQGDLFGAEPETEEAQAARAPVACCDA
ncbi:hypothetical protein SAMN05421811_103100 [Nonomuraea wenchangensis]|uniref:Uncharacterized protein n=1 Tax=Nonomuraea wenchangensis TaxID=568860 RepID=A0A1I0EKV1_9ACTN|nr:hypothetical protein SAMN05421811_103100 [Nonomuraea wenchangensis]